MTTALQHFMEVTGIKVAVAVPSDLLNLSSPGVSGMHTPEEALRLLLAGTPLIYQFTANNIVQISRQNATQPQQPLEAPTVSVQGTQQQGGYLTDSSSLPRLTAPLAQTPQSIIVVPQQALKDRNATTLQEALRNVSGISLVAGEGTTQGDGLTMRGLNASNDFYLDGSRDVGNYFRDPFDLESVEVIEGPSSTAIGAGSSGGLINQVSKTPQLGTFSDVGVTVGTDNTHRVSLDTNEQLSSHSAFRLNAMANENDIAGRDVARNRRWGVAPSLALGLGTPTRLTFSYYHLTEDDIPDYGIPYLGAGPAPVPTSNFYGFADADHFFQNTDIFTMRVEHDLSDSLTFRNQTRYATYSRSFQATTASIPTLTPGEPLNDVTVTRSIHAEDGTESYLDNQTDITGNFTTGAIKHATDVGMDVSRTTEEDFQSRYSGLPTTNLINPDYNQPFTYTSLTPKVNAHLAADDLSFFALDTITLNSHWQLNGGVRWDAFSAFDNELVTATHSTQGVTATTENAGVTYNFQPNGNIYFSYGTAFDPAAYNLVLTTTSQLAPPGYSQSYELGTKWTFGQKLLLQGALFHELAYNARLAEDNYTSTVDAIGNERIDGAQVQATGRIGDRWQVMGGWTLLDGIILSSTVPADVGNQLINVPRNSFTFWTTYETPDHAEFGLGAVGVGSRYASASLSGTSTVIPQAPGYWRLDAMVKYPLNRKLAVQLNLYNLLDKTYFDQLYTDHVIPGAGFSGTLGIEARL